MLLSARKKQGPLKGVDRDQIRARLYASVFELRLRLGQGGTFVDMNATTCARAALKAFDDGALG